MTRDELIIAFPHGCLVRQTDNPDATGRVVGWGRKGDRLYVSRPGLRSGPRPYRAERWERWERVTDAFAPGPTVEEHW